ncbi:MFS transporter [Gordonia bronchialis]|nr:MFS transporter [Gordonia bronchialis]
MTQELVEQPVRLAWHPDVQKTFAHKNIRTPCGFQERCPDGFARDVQPVGDLVAEHESGQRPQHPAREQGQVEIHAQVQQDVGELLPLGRPREDGVEHLGVLQSKTWGWLAPLNPPVIGETTIAPLGVSPVAYLILIGAVILWIFVNRQQALSRTGRQPLLNVRLLRIDALRSGLAGFLVQYFAIAALFFVVPVYLQTMLGKDAMQTGLKILPLSAGLVVFSVLGSWLTARRSTRFIARVGQLTMAVGILLTLGAVEPALRGTLFAVGMFVVGAGFGLLASQLGNANMSAVEERDTSEVGGLQGTFQNLGSSFGTAIVGSVFILLLGSGFTTSVQDAQTLSPSQKQQITTSLNETGVPIISEADAQTLVARAGGSDDAAAEVGDLYADSQIQALKQALFVVFALTVLSLFASRRLPDRIASEDTADDRSD